MKNRLILHILIAMFLFSSCHKDEDFSEGFVTNATIQINSTIVPLMDGKSRASFNIDTDGKVMFVDGDYISLFVTLQDGTPTKYRAVYNEKNNTWSLANNEVLNWEQYKG